METRERFIDMGMSHSRRAKELHADILLGRGARDRNDRLGLCLELPRLSREWHLCRGLYAQHARLDREGDCEGLLRCRLELWWELHLISRVLAHHLVAWLAHCRKGILNRNTSFVRLRDSGLLVTSLALG